MSKYVGSKGDDSMIYDCYAVSNHLGHSTNSGHYKTYAKNSHDNKWYRFNDDLVTVVNSPNTTVVSKDAYNIFYRRRDWHKANKEGIDFDKMALDNE